MPVDAKWLLPTDDPRVRRNRAEVLAFEEGPSEEERAILLAQSPPQARPEPAVPKASAAMTAEAPATEAPKRLVRREPPAVDPARVQALLDAAPASEAGPLHADPARTRQELMQLFADLDQLARRLTGTATGG